MSNGVKVSWVFRGKKLCDGYFSEAGLLPLVGDWVILKPEATNLSKPLKLQVSKRVFIQPEQMDVPVVQLHLEQPEYNS